MNADGSLPSKIPLCEFCQERPAVSRVHRCCSPRCGRLLRIQRNVDLRSPIARWVWELVKRDPSLGPLDSVAQQVGGIDRHNLRKILGGTTKNPRLWVLEALARVGGTSVDELRTLLPNGETGEEAAARRMGIMAPQYKRESGRTRSKILLDPNSSYRKKFESVWKDPKRVGAARTELRRLWNDPGWRDQQTQKIVEATGTMEHRIRKALAWEARGKTKLSHADVETFIARQHRKFPHHNDEVRALVLAQIQRRGLATPMGRPRQCARAAGARPAGCRRRVRGDRAGAGPRPGLPPALVHAQASCAVRGLPDIPGDPSPPARSPDTVTTLFVSSVRTVQTTFYDICTLPKRLFMTSQTP
jgi:hypothetical protein